MALKDWKKIGKNEWENTKRYNHIGILISRFEYGQKVKTPYLFVKFTEDDYVILGVFKTKSKALKYAKNYMKKH